MRKIASHYLISGGSLIKNPIITLSDDGEIVAVEANVDNIDSHAGVEFYSGVLIPGMVNSHSHLEYSYVEGMIPQGGGLPVFISSIINIKQTDNTTDSEKSAKAQYIDSAMWSDGVTAVGDHNNNDYVYDVKEKSNIYYHSLVELFDMDGMSGDEAFHWGVDRANVHHSKGLAATVIPHATYTMDDRILSLCGGSATSDKGVKADGVLSVHFKESVEMAGEQESGRIFESISPERDSIMLVHSIYASTSDIDRAKEVYGDKLTVVTCPLSNIYIEDNITDIEYLRQSGVRIAIGTDSLSSNRVISMVDEMKVLQERYPNIDLAEILKWATLGGAEALCIDSWAGSVEVGKRPGLVNITGVDLDTMKLTSDSKSKRIV